MVGMTFSSLSFRAEARRAGVEESLAVNPALGGVRMSTAYSRRDPSARSLRSLGRDDTSGSALRQRQGRSTVTVTATVASYRESFAENQCAKRGLEPCLHDQIDLDVQNCRQFVLQLDEPKK